MFRWTQGLCAALLLASACLAQVAGSRTILGTVKDQSGAAIPQAKVNFLRVDTGTASDTTTNNDGYFASPPLPIGNYRIRIESAGMKAWEQSQLLETGKTIEIAPVMQAGQVTETVNVTASAPLVTTTEATDASTLDSKRIKELPINGRDLNTLLSQTAPGLEQVYDVNGGVRTGGSMVYSTNYMQDGAPSNNREFGGSMNLQGLESIAEVRVETSTSSARYNAPASIIVNTRSGTNELHLSAYEVIRNNAFGVARARQDISFNPANPYRTPKLIRNEFGGSVSGPVVIPKLYDGRNRTFFFFSREGAELRQGLTKDFSVPTVAMRNGDFSALVDLQGRKIQLYDPLTTRLVLQPNGRAIAVRSPFINNQIPAGRISPLARYIYGITPLPNDTTNPVVATNYKVAVPTNANPSFSDNPTTIRVDHRLREKDSIFVKANGGRRLAWFQGTGTGTGAPTLGYETNVTYLPMQAVSGVINWTHIFTPTFFVETNISHTWQSTKTVDGPPDKQANFSQLLGLPNPYGEIGFPNITGLGNFMTYTEGDNRRALTSKILSIQQNYSLIRGTHDIQFGWALLKDTEHLLPDQGAISGSASFSSLATALQSPTLGSATQPQAVAQTGYDGANFFLGYAGSYNVGLKRNYMRVRNTNLGLYVQDNYKLSKRLIVTPGLRWDINPGLSEENYQLNSFDVASHSVVLPQPLDYYVGNGSTTQQVIDSFKSVGMTFKTADEIGRSQKIFQNNYFDFGPRVGLAYQALDGKAAFVIRGGYGMYISTIPMRTLLAQFSSSAPFRATFAYAPNSPATSPDGIQNYLLRSAPTLVAGLNTSQIDTSLALSRGQSVVGLDTRFPNLKIHEWNATVEKELGAAMVFRIRYNGKHGVNADQLTEINPQLTDFGWYVTQGRILPQGAFSNVARRTYDQNAYTSVRLLGKTGYLNTQTFTLEFQRRFRNGYGFQAFYTLTNALRLAGNSFRDGVGAVPGQFLPGAVPTDPAQLNRFLNYQRDSAIPQHRVRWNFNYDIPVGRNRKFASGVNRWIDGVIGGWKLAGSGTVVSSWWQLPTNNWGATNPLQIYGTSRKVLDCRSTSALATNPADERCYEGYLFYNGYISQRQIASRNPAGLRTGVFGLPADYKPFQSPINPWPAGGQTSDPGSNLYDTNLVNVRLNDGTIVQTTYDTGLHSFRNQWFLGPLNWQQDASLQKFFYIREASYLRFNLDVFNVFNTQGLNVPGFNATNGDGIASLQSSYGGFGFRPRQVQLGLRFEW